MAHAGSEEIAKPRLESRPGVEYQLREDGIQSWRLSWLQAPEGSSKLLWSIRAIDAVTLRCWNLPQVGQLLFDRPGRLAARGPVCPVLHELPGDGVCQNGAQARGASRPVTKFVDGSPHLAARVREVDRIKSFLPSLLVLLF